MISKPRLKWVTGSIKSWVTHVLCATLWEGPDLVVCFWLVSVGFWYYSCIHHVWFQWQFRDKWAARSYQKLSAVGQAVTAGLSGLDKRKSWLISNSGDVARRYRWGGWGVSRSDKKDGRVSFGGGAAIDGDQTFVVHPRLYCWCCMSRLELKGEEFMQRK